MTAGPSRSAVTLPSYGCAMDIIFTITVWTLLGWGLRHSIPVLTAAEKDEAVTS